MHVIFTHLVFKWLVCCLTGFYQLNRDDDNAVMMMMIVKMMMMRARMKLKPTRGAPSRKIHRNQKVKTSVPGYLKPD